ncbi:MAG: hypothetical protein IH851_00385 [Armatimonadetes bacterium]|nr:hypothetical protein [Armatimonadota bacterium]
MQEQVLNKIGSNKLKVSVVWTPVLGGDNRRAAQDAVKLVPDKRATHYWDADKSLGLSYGKIVELPRGGKLAWDIYFVHDGKAEWKDGPPKPDYWMHQLGRDERRLDGDKLREAVQKIMKAGS